jgi:hypothetical protein
MAALSVSTPTCGTDTCGVCGRAADAPRKAFRDGALYECCVADTHDAHVSDDEHAAFVARARAAGIDGKW